MQRAAIANPGADPATTLTQSSRAAGIVALALLLGSR
jgi:hypothetical protein